MKKWQHYLDKTFPDGCMIEWKWGDPDTDPVFHVPRLFVLEDSPSPIVWYHPLEAPEQYREVRQRWVGWTTHNSVPYVARTQTPEGQGILVSSYLTPASIETNRAARHITPPDWVEPS